ncbi:molybdopterin/thiamine biosynthesis adenylyltransferase [Tumebacillus sp. BK434]|uniref:HesA/MoeB/ThiF family protein n=1 Tax=Tumebacillus sp. BK434 TaxID=2512169 RepID=UPI0010E88623|nr:ThiF family adenylyltransferase [Tumebacillus sp. BK434]TCP49178.1 molybdopterin/thiamine biosynthesis adenylyltransferase [Tumebacillus sp. BK434]
MRPKFKPILKPLMRNGDFLRVGMETNVYDLEDPDGQIERFLSSLDGTLTIDDIAAASGLSGEEVQGALETFNELGFLDDAAAPVGNLTERDLDRYRANLTYFTNYSTLEQSKLEYQQRLKDSTVAVLGLGGASLMAAGLAGLGVGKIIGLDCDRVELSNLNRQYIYREDDIGKLKTDAVAEHLRRLNRDLEVVTYNQKVTTAESLLDVIADADLVINGIDTPTMIASRWVNSACVHLEKPMLLGGVTNNRLLWQRFLPHSHGCYDCFLIHCLRLDPDAAMQLRALYGQVFESRNTAMSPHVALLSGFITSEVAKHLAGYAEPMLPSTTMEMDLVTMAMKQSDPFTRLENCPTCGAGKHERAGIEPVELEELIQVSQAEALQA